MNEKIVFPTNLYMSHRRVHTLSILSSFTPDCDVFSPPMDTGMEIFLIEVDLTVYCAEERRDDDLLHGGNCQALDIRNR